jgi:RNA-directed DNA polymerase
MGETQSSQPVSTKLQKIAEQARINPEMVFTSLVHLMDVELLTEAFGRLRKSAAPGIDGVTAAEYAGDLEENLSNLHERLRTGKYKAQPVKRAWIGKEDGSQRPLGLPALEDKIVQRAVTMLLETVYEQDFHDFSYGFRPGRSPHQALHTLREQCKSGTIGWIVDADISQFFDNLDRGQLREILKQRVNDGGIIRLLGKWFHAGVLDAESLSHPEKGTVQGGVISPILSNIYLHHVLDDWFVKEVQPRMKGRCFLLRFADDFVGGFEYDARRFMEVLPKRFARFGLTIHAKKTKLIEFRRPGRRERTGKGSGSFDFLGFTHYWAKSLKGYWVLKRKTAKKRLERTIRALWEWCRENRHEPIKAQYQKLCQKIRGHIQYFGIRGNMRALEVVIHEARKAWRFWLSRRSQKGKIIWERFKKLMAKLVLPRARIVHQV